MLYSILASCAVAVFSSHYHVEAIGDHYNAKAWQSASEYPVGDEFPEVEYLSEKPSSSISFTGGGSRSYLCSMGYLAGLNELGLIPGIRYMTGVSGGSWATIAYSYKQIDVDDKTYLGPVVFPADITREGLSEMDPNCARSYTDNDFVKYTLGAIKDGSASTIAEGWTMATQKYYFEPAGIKAGAPFSLNEDTVSDIVKRNPSLKNTEFIMPTNKDRPFPMVGTTLVGPAEGAGYTFDNRNLTMIEISPLYIGQFRTQTVGFNYHSATEKSHHEVIGGAIEPFAFGITGAAPLTGLKSGQVSDTLKVPVPPQVFDLQWAGSASGYAEGAFFESLKPNELSNTLGMHFVSTHSTLLLHHPNILVYTMVLSHVCGICWQDYWSPSSRHPSSKDTLFCDGGSYENIMLPSMLQRGLKKIALFFNSVTPLQPSTTWDVLTEPPLKSQIDDGFSSLFGVLPEDYVKWEERSFDFSKDQFFSTDDYAPTVLALQDAQQKGDGIIYTANLTTVNNDWWGIPAGLTAEITFVYLGRLKNWEAQLSDEMRELLVPAEDADDLAHTIEDGPFRHFPHYPTSGGLLNAEQANVLSDMTGWLIHQNAELFESIFS